jgi:hypothetical protein
MGSRCGEAVFFLWTSNYIYVCATKSFDVLKIKIALVNIAYAVEDTIYHVDTFTSDTGNRTADLS